VMIPVNIVVFSQTLSVPIRFVAFIGANENRHFGRLGGIRVFSVDKGF